MTPIDRRTLFRAGAGLAAGGAVTGLAPGFASPAAAAVHYGQPLVPDPYFAYFGAYSPDSTPGIGQPERLEGASYLDRKLAINHVFYNADDPATVLTNVRTRMNLDIAQGRIPMLSYGLGRDGSGDAGKFLRLKNIADGNATALARIADLANELKAMNNGSIFLRFAWEVDTASRYKDHAAEYVDAWRNARSVFADVGVTNVSWVWCPSRLAFGNPDGANGANKFYPGNNYVNWIGCDGYSRPADSILGPWPSFEELFTDAHAYSVLKGKPFMVGETGVQRTITSPPDVHQAYWYKDLWQNLYDLKFSNLKALVLWNMDDADTLWRFDQTSYNPGALTQVQNIAVANRMSMMRDDITH